MSAADFQAVVSALELGGMPVRPEPPPIHTAAVLGGGALGQALAAACLAGGLEVRLWSASGATLSALAGAGALTVRGDDLVGSYSVDSDAPVHVELTGSIDQAMSGADVVFITGTVADQRVAAMLAAQWAVADQMLVMVPGLTFGALELHWWLRTGPRRPACLVAELNPEPWTITPTGPAAIELTGRPAARLATMPAKAGAAPPHRGPYLVERHQRHRRGPGPGPRRPRIGARSRNLAARGCPPVRRPDGLAHPSACCGDRSAGW